MYSYHLIFWWRIVSPAKEVKSSIQSLDDLPKQTKITYGVLKGGSLFNFFQKSSSSPFREIYRNMEEWKTFMNTTKEGVERVQNDQDFAYMTDQPYLDYYNSKQPCNTMLLTNLLEGKSYGIGLRRHSDLTNDFSVAILKVSHPRDVWSLGLTRVTLFPSPSSSCPRFSCWSG